MVGGYTCVLWYAEVDWNDKEEGRSYMRTLYEETMREGQLVDVEGCVSRWSMMASSASGFASSRNADKELRGTDNDIDFGQLRFLLLPRFNDTRLESSDLRCNIHILASSYSYA